MFFVKIRARMHRSTSNNSSVRGLVVGLVSKRQHCGIDRFSGGLEVCSK